MKTRITLFRLTLSLFLLNLVRCSTYDTHKLAWNGHTPPGSTDLATFTPFYVPPGAKAYDSSSKLLHYSGKWRTVYSKRYISNSTRRTAEPGASVTFTFIGTGVEWYGSSDPHHGQCNVYVDGKRAQRVFMRSKVARTQQRLFAVYGLPFAEHTLKLVNLGKTKGSQSWKYLDVDAFVVTRIQTSASSKRSRGGSKRDTGWSMVQRGSTGVHAMQLAVISETHAIIIDKVEHNPLTISGHPAWAALYKLDDDTVTPLHMVSNSFCAGGTFLSNGTLINVGGNPIVETLTSAADFGDVDGLQAIRLFHPCDSESVSNCQMVENHGRIRMASPRWYSTSVRLHDGSAMILGGSKKGGWINNATVNNPTVEYWPPKSLNGSNGLPITVDFLRDTLNSNLFPITISLPDGKVFVAANRDAMIYDWRSQTERRLPPIPNGVRVTYPMTGTGVLLPLKSTNGYAAEILLCGGSTVDDTKAGYAISSQDLASAQCSRIVLTDAGIQAGWQVEQMPQARTMADAVILPTGQILIVNGAGSGISGYGNVLNQVGTSNADHPVFSPVLYDPEAPSGQRFVTNGLPTSQIPRLYHSVATLTPSGKVMVAGSNPNLDRSEVLYGTEYRVEWISPPYMNPRRPVIDSIPKLLGFGKTFSITLKGLADGGHDVKVALMDLGFVTHAVHANSRHVWLDTTTFDQRTLTVVAPPSGNIYPPGPAFLFVLVDGIPSEGVKIMVGSGDGPPVDHEVLANMLKQTSADQYDKDRGKNDDSSE